MTLTSQRSRFENAYAGIAPWETGRPQPAFVSRADKISGIVIDIGCGTGENSLFFAERGCQITGIDFLSVPISRARTKATQRNISAAFVVMDALSLKGLSEAFDCAIDCGLFHAFDDEDRRRYVEGLSTALKPGGKLFLLCFSQDEPGTIGPRRISREELESAFSGKWIIESIEADRFEIRTDLPDLQFSQGGAKAWFCVIRRI